MDVRSLAGWSHSRTGADAWDRARGAHAHPVSGLPTGCPSRDEATRILRQGIFSQI